jgi:hypothetical protein
MIVLKKADAGTNTIVKCYQPCADSWNKCGSREKGKSSQGG